MKKKTIFGTVLFVLLVLQAQTIFANGESESSSPPPVSTQQRDPFSSLNPAERINLAAAQGDLNTIMTLLQNGANINSRSTNGNYTPIILASANGHFDIVKYLVDNGANVNARDNQGKSALNLAYEKGEMEIYDYLIAHGAREFEPNQIAQQPATPAPQTNVYVQPSAPAQTPTPAPAPSAPTFQTGTYAWSNSGVNMTMSFNVGMVSAFLNRSGIWTGTYSINGNQLIISVIRATGDYSRLQGMTYSYTITSSTSFSGSGETWVRTGY